MRGGPAQGMRRTSSQEGREVRGLFRTERARDGIGTRETVTLRPPGRAGAGSAAFPAGDAIGSMDKMHNLLFGWNVKNKKIKVFEGQNIHAAGCAQYGAARQFLWPKRKKWLDISAFWQYTKPVSHNGLLRQKGDLRHLSLVGAPAKFVKNAETLRKARVELCVSAQNST